MTEQLTLSLFTSLKALESYLRTSGRRQSQVCLEFGGQPRVKMGRQLESCSRHSGGYLKHDTKSTSYQWEKKHKQTEPIETCNDLDGYQRHYAEWKKTISKGYTQSDSRCVTVLK